MNSKDDWRIKIKHCRACALDLPSTDFTRSSVSKDGYRSTCRNCSRSAKITWYRQYKSKTLSRMQKRRAELRSFINTLKSQPCVDCGKSYHPSLMDFDHRDDTLKLDGVTMVMNRTLSKDKVIAEVAKCDLVCCLCHRVRTWNRINPENPISIFF